MKINKKLLNPKEDYINKNIEWESYAVPFINSNHNIHPVSIDGMLNEIIYDINTNSISNRIHFEKKVDNSFLFVEMNYKDQKVSELYLAFKFNFGYRTALMSELFQPDFLPYIMSIYSKFKNGKWLLERNIAVSNITEIYSILYRNLTIILMKNFPNFYNAGYFSNFENQQMIDQRNLNLNLLNLSQKEKERYYRKRNPRKKYAKKKIKKSYNDKKKTKKFVM